MRRCWRSIDQAAEAARVAKAGESAEEAERPITKAGARFNAP